jgi:Tfp pilus assembly protein FimV
MSKLNDDIDGLFKLPLTEFISARKSLAARLKKNGFVDEAEGVKALTKPSVSAWAVNQLFWLHREAFDELIATGDRFRQAQASGKMVNMREALEARREALSHLSDLATPVLRDAGHNPSLDTLRRIGTTLEALSVASSFSDRPTLGRLIEDIDPPGFDALGSFTPGTGTIKRKPQTRPIVPTERVLSPSSKRHEGDASRREERQARINRAKASLQQERKSLTAARAAVKSLESAQKKAEAAMKEAAQQKREAEARFKKASAASTDASLRAQSITAELTKAAKRLDEAKRAVENATKELETSFRESG